MGVVKSIFLYFLLNKSRKQAYGECKSTGKCQNDLATVLHFDFSANYDENIYHNCHVSHCNPALLLFLYEQSDWSAQHTS